MGSVFATNSFADKFGATEKSSKSSSSPPSPSSSLVCPSYTPCCRFDCVIISCAVSLAPPPAAATPSSVCVCVLLWVLYNTRRSFQVCMCVCVCGCVSGAALSSQYFVHVRLSGVCVCHASVFYLCIVGTRAFDVCVSNVCRSYVLSLHA